MRVDIERVKKESVGKWLGIYQNLGIEVPLPPGEHGPCPVCMGTDRFRLDKDTSRGTCFCNQCQPQSSDGFSLVQRALGIDFIEAVRRVGECIGSIDPDIKTDNNGSDEANIRKFMNEIWSKSVGMDSKNNAVDYLLSRGIYKTPSDTRYCSECYCAELKTNLPAMVALFRDKNGSPVGMQRTYLQNGTKADLKCVRKTISVKKGTMAGGSVRLVQFDDTLGIAEGIETALSAYQLFKLPVWATLSNTLLEAWVPPDKAKKIVIFGDNDSNFAGQGSAYKLANKLYERFDRIVEVQIPEYPHKDWNYVLLAQRPTTT